MTEIQQLGAKLREIRIKEGLSIEDMAEKLSMPRQNLNQIEVGTKAVSIPKLTDIFSKLGYDLEFNFKVKKRILRKIYENKY